MVYSVISFIHQFKRQKEKELKESGDRVQVIVPEKEATALCKKLRHHADLQEFTLSCYGYINKTGIRAIHVAVDKQGVDDSHSRYDIYYTAAKVNEDIGRVVNNAVRKISAHFE